MLVLVLSDFGLPGTLPLLGPLVVLPLGTSLSGPPVGYLLVFIPVFSRRDRWLFGRGSNVRYVHLIELIFGFLMVFILCQSDIY